MELGLQDQDSIVLDEALEPDDVLILEADDSGAEGQMSFEDAEIDLFEVMPFDDGRRHGPTPPLAERQMPPLIQIFRSRTARWSNIPGRMPK